MLLLLFFKYVLNTRFLRNLAMFLSPFSYCPMCCRASSFRLFLQTSFCGFVFLNPCSFHVRYSRKSLKVLGTVGEPINPEAWLWYYKVVGEERCPIVDTFWQTETVSAVWIPLWMSWMFVWMLQISALSRVSAFHLQTWCSLSWKYIGGASMSQNHLHLSSFSYVLLVKALQKSLFDSSFLAVPLSQALSLMLYEIYGLS